MHSVGRTHENSMSTTTAIAFVTGAGSGIGRATCQLLAEQGATVVAADINKESADSTVIGLSGRNHLSVQLDVSKKECVEAVIQTVLKKYSSPPTITVNCAGLVLFQPLLKLTEDTYNKIFDVNVKGTVWVTQAVCRELVATKKGGTIVNIGSVAKQGHPNWSIYSATKGAVESFSISAAKEFGPYGIRVNVVSPGFTDTAMIECIPQEVKNHYKNNTPLNRIGNAKEVAEVIAFLASEKSSYVNGTSMYVHGGFL